MNESISTRSEVYGENRNVDKMNIMYIFNDTAFGGAGQSLLDTLIEIRHKINPIIIIRDNMTAENKFHELGVSYYKIHFPIDYVKIGDVDVEKKEVNMKQSYEAALQLISIIEKEKIHLIHINSSVSYFGAIAAIMAQIPYIWHIRELMEEQFGCQFLNEEIRRILYEKADRLIAISNYVQKQYYKKYHIDNMLRIYNGLDIARFKQEIKRGRKYKDIFLAAGMITPEKGQWDVIRAVELVVKRGYTGIKTVIVGEGAEGYVWALRKYITKNGLHKNIYIIPFQEDLSDLRKQASYSITSSQNEALGRVTIEAMLAGNIVIGARSGGTTEIIGENEQRGFLYELGNVQELADVLIKVMKYSDESKDIFAVNAQIYAEENFDSKQYCKELLNLYNKEIVSFIPKKKDEFLNELKEGYESKKHKKVIQNGTMVSYKKDAMYKAVLKWLKLKQKGFSLDRYFTDCHIHSIAIYGMGHLGCRLYDELENSQIEIKYLIDRNPNGMDKIFEFSSLDKEKLDVDAIVVTVVFLEYQIINEIKAYGYKRVIGLNEVLNSFDGM